MTKKNHNILKLLKNESGGTSANSSSIVIIADKVEFKGGDTFLGDFDTSSILNNALMLQATLVE